MVPFERTVAREKHFDYVYKEDKRDVPPPGKYRPKNRKSNFFLAKKFVRKIKMVRDYWKEQLTQEIKDNNLKIAQKKSELAKKKVIMPKTCTRDHMNNNGIENPILKNLTERGDLQESGVSLSKEPIMSRY